MTQKNSQGESNKKKKNTKFDFKVLEKKEKKSKKSRIWKNNLYYYTYDY